MPTLAVSVCSGAGAGAGAGAGVAAGAGAGVWALATPVIAASARATDVPTSLRFISYPLEVIESGDDLDSGIPSAFRVPLHKNMVFQ
jgi:hypothetical protein